MPLSTSPWTRHVRTRRRVLPHRPPMAERPKRRSPAPRRRNPPARCEHRAAPTVWSDRHQHRHWHRRHPLRPRKRRRRKGAGQVPNNRRSATRRHLIISIISSHHQWNRLGSSEVRSIPEALGATPPALLAPGPALYARTTTKPTSGRGTSARCAMVQGLPTAAPVGMWLLLIASKALLLLYNTLDYYCRSSQPF